MHAPESLATRVGFGDKWREIYLTRKTIRHEFPRLTLPGTLFMLNTLRKVEDHDNHVRWIYLTTVLYVGESQKYARINIMSVLT